MKPTIYLCIAFVVLLFVACQSDKKPVTNTTPVAPQLPNANTPVATAGVQHYICPNNCAGSGGPAAGACPVCGTQYAHNAAFHNQPGANANNQQLPPSPIINSPQQTNQPQVTPQQVPTQTTQTPEPAQNAAGVWHYVCSKGCAGGAGARGYCSKCGAGLDHNTAYHQ